MSWDERRSVDQKISFAVAVAAVVARAVAVAAVTAFDTTVAVLMDPVHRVLPALAATLVECLVLVVSMQIFDVANLKLALAAHLAALLVSVETLEQPCHTVWSVVQALDVVPTVFDTLASSAAA